MLRNLGLCLTLAAGLACPLMAQDAPSHDKNVDVRSPAGDLHVGKDADAKKVGLPLYPGARLKNDDSNSSQANLSLLTDAFGMKLVVANYVSDDAPAKIIDFYRGKLKRYGKVLECHSQKSGVDVHNDDKDSSKGDDKQLTCDQDSGPVTELKVGTEDNQHVVSVEPADNKGTHFALVYVHTRGKQGDI
ncbi:MAG TPA: hypothetical protein VGS27_01155 [Candidatus Sulfotelmatobacter sp.]|nr:hypothetical protein [Candidatus Sulfotelmatobacter sp.]